MCQLNYFLFCCKEKKDSLGEHTQFLSITYLRHFYPMNLLFLSEVFLSFLNFPIPKGQGCKKISFFILKCSLITFASFRCLHPQRSILKIESQRFLVFFVIREPSFFFLSVIVFCRPFFCKQQVNGIYFIIFFYSAVLGGVFDCFILLHHNLS